MSTAQDQQSRALSTLRHLYSQMVRGLVKDSAQAKRIAEGMLSPAIQKIEQAARTLPAGMEPALCQRRMRPTWRADGEDWTEWKDCTPEAADECERATVNDWQFEVRRLYTAALGRVPPGYEPILITTQGKSVSVLFREVEEANAFGRAMLAAAPQPAAQERKPLTDEQIEAIPVWVNFVGLWPQSRKEIARAIEAAHGIEAAP